MALQQSAPELEVGGLGQASGLGLCLLCRLARPLLFRAPACAALALKLVEMPVVGDSGFGSRSSRPLCCGFPGEGPAGSVGLTRCKDLLVRQALPNSGRGRAPRRPRTHSSRTLPATSGGRSGIYSSQRPLRMEKSAELWRRPSSSGPLALALSLIATPTPEPAWDQQ